ncbi:MAG: hypothetical protein JSS91_14765 [Bacteroidetes bacterium]|nr:hypothetical protein [Bacteroidota bacterium]
MRQLIYILFILASLITGLNAVYRLNHKSDLPFAYHSSDNNIISDSSFTEIQISDRIIAVDNFPVSSILETEFIADTKQIGDEVSLEIYSGNDTYKTVSVRLNKYYKDNFFILTTLLVGLSFWFPGVYVCIFGRKDKSARLLCLTLVTISLAVFTSPCSFERSSDWMGYVIRISHTISYIFGGMFFLHFSLIFPAYFSRNQNQAVKILYFTVSGFSVFTAYILFIAMRDLNVSYLKIYSDLWGTAQFFLLAALALSSVILILKYKKLPTRKEKSRLEWIFWGLSAGAGPFIFFWLIPGIFGLDFPVKEDILLSFLILIPVSFSIAVVKHRLFDIEVIIKRSIIYSLLLVFMVLMYFGIIYGLSFLTGEIIGEHSGIINLTAVAFIALAFNPVRVKLKNYVDILFYRQKYTFKNAISDLNRKITKCSTAGILGNELLEEINSQIPVKSAAVCIFTPANESLRIIAQFNFDNLSEDISSLKVKEIFSKFVFPFGVTDKVEKDVNVDTSIEEFFKRRDINLGIPLTLESDNLIGIILLGSKLSELRYSADDIELLSTMGSAVSLALKRLQLQEQIIKEELEIQNLRELDKMKSYFVATVSHDLKTPLSSIKIFTDLLQNEKITFEKKKEYLNYIDGETDRLNRMINNILNYAKIEKGIKSYNFTMIDVNDVLNKVLKSMTYDLILNKFKLDLNISKDKLYINGDCNEITLMFENLISNSIKYSGKTKYLKVISYTDDNNVLISIEDKGIGISPGNLKDIFDPYYRDKKIEQTGIKGTGLGLAIVKNIIDAHSGNIEVFSIPGKGSKFLITLPLYINENKNFIH